MIHVCYICIIILSILFLNLYSTLTIIKTRAQSASHTVSKNCTQPTEKSALKRKYEDVIRKSECNVKVVESAGMNETAKAAV